MKILFLSDTHLGLDYTFRPRVEKARRGADFFANYQRALESAVDQRVDLVIHGGDLFDRAQVPDALLPMAYEPLMDVARAGIPVIISPGNHERSQLPGSLFMQHPNIHVFHEAETFPFHIDNLQIAISGFPFHRHNIRASFASLLEATRWVDYDAALRLLLIHQSVEGAQVGPVNYTFRYGPDVISKSQFTEDFPVVLSGHIHRHQVLVTDTGIRVIYPGSIERTSFAELGEPKGFCMLEFQPEYGDVRLTKLDFVRLPTRPMLNIDLTGMTGSEDDLIAAGTAQLQALDAHSMIRIKVSPDQARGSSRIGRETFWRKIVPDETIIKVTIPRNATRKPMRIRRSRPGEKPQPAPPPIEFSAIRQPDQIRKLPQQPGVYLFHGEGGELLYVGKAKNIRRRVSSYRQMTDPDADPRLRAMVSNTAIIEHFTTATELLALLLEDRLIKRLAPLYNLRHNQFRKAAYLAVTQDQFPAILITKDPAKPDCRTYGPFRDEFAARRVKDLLCRQFGLRSCNDKNPVTKCTDYDLGICRGPCIGAVTTAENEQFMEQAIGFLNGDADPLSTAIELTMQAAADKMDFEQAAELRDLGELCRSFFARRQFDKQFFQQALIVRYHESPGGTYLIKQGSYYRYYDRILNGKQAAAKLANADMDNWEGGDLAGNQLVDRPGIIVSWLKQNAALIEYSFQKSNLVGVPAEANISSAAQKIV